MKNWRYKLPQISRLRTDRASNFRLAAVNQGAHRRICAGEKKYARLKDISSIFAIVWRRARSFADAGRPGWASCRSGLGRLTPTSLWQYTGMKKYRIWLILLQLIGPCWRCRLAWKKTKKRYVYAPNNNEFVQSSPSWIDSRAWIKWWINVCSISCLCQFLNRNNFCLPWPLITMPSLGVHCTILKKNFRVYFQYLLLFIVTKMAYSLGSNWSLSADQNDPRIADVELHNSSSI